MAPGRPRVRVGGKQLWCQTCVKDKSAPSGKYKPGSDIAQKVAHSDWVPPAPDDDAMALHHRYAGQPGHVAVSPSGDPHYEIEHPSGYLGRIGHGPYMEISHAATPGEAHATVAVGADTDAGHVLHPSMTTPDPVVNHARAMWHLDNWVKTWGEQYGNKQPAIRTWKGRRGLASKHVASRVNKEVPTVRKVAMTNIRTGQRLIVVAHDSGDGQTIYHCPFCGSGQVIARSDGTIECEFCHTMFTVQVQPEYNAFPQTIDGSPVQVPGMPGQIGQGGPGADPNDPTADAQPTDPTANADDDGTPDAQDGDTNGDGVSDNFAGPASAQNQPPWLKGAVLRTSTGTLLDPEDFVAHLAIKHAPDRQAVIQKVRATRRPQ